MELSPDKFFQVAFPDVWSFAEAACADTYVCQDNAHNPCAGILKESFCGLPGVKGPETVRDLLNNGWTEGAARLGAALDAINIPPAQSIRRRREWGDQGDELDMQRVYNGQLDQSWRRMSRRLGTGKRRVRILATIGACAATSHDTLFWRAAAAVKLCELLTKAGYNVEVSCHWTGWLNASQGKGWNLSYTAKQASAPFDLATMAAAVACPATFRTLGFHAMWKLCPFNATGSLGTMGCTPPTLALGREPGPEEIVLSMPQFAHSYPPEHKAECDDAGITIDGDPLAQFTAQNAAEWIEETLARLEGRNITEAEAA